MAGPQWADADPCPLNCGHPFHGLRCEERWTRNRFGALVTGNKPCDCPGPWADERTNA